MPEELRIIVVDQSGGRGSAPSRPGALMPSAPTGGFVQSIPAIAPVPSRMPAGRGVGGGTATGAFSALIAGRSVGQAAAAGNVAGAASGLAGVAGLTGAAAIAGPIGIAVGGIAAGFAIATKAVTSFARKVESETTKLAGFSGEVALAQAQTEIRRTFASLRRAQRIGPGLAAAENVRSQFEDTLSDLGTEILNTLLSMAEQFRPAIELLSFSLNTLTQFLEAWGPLIGKMLAVLGGSQFFALVKAALQWLGVEVEKQDGELPEDPHFKEFFDMATQNIQFWPFGQPLPGGAVVQPSI